MKLGAFTTGGPVEVGHGIYIERDADRALLELCRSNTHTYVLAPRQIGKTSLILRAIGRLTPAIRAVRIDLRWLGVNTTADQWYTSLLRHIKPLLERDIDELAWWAERAHLTHAERLVAFLRDVVLREVKQPIVVFIDEIDLTLSLPFAADDFFGAIRSLYDARVQSPDLARLSFVLIGVAAPGELIRDPRRAPFNIGQAVAMTDFTFDEAAIFIQGFDAPLDDSLRVLGYVLRWTRGQPYLTQKMCRALAEGASEWTEEGVRRLAQQLFLSGDGANDIHLVPIQRMMTLRADNPYAALQTYRDIWRAGVSRKSRSAAAVLLAFREYRATADDSRSAVKATLKLSGVVRSDGTRLAVRNPIYRAVFDDRWVAKQLREVKAPADYWLRRLQLTLFWMAIILLLGLIPVSWFAWTQRNEAQNAWRVAEANRAFAEAAALSLRALAIRESAPEHSKALLLSAAESSQTPQVDQALRQVLMTPEPCIVLGSPIYGGGWLDANTASVLLSGVASSPKNTTLNGNSLNIHMLPSGAQQATLSDDGRYILISESGATRVEDVQSTRVLATLEGAVGPIGRAMVTTDGRRLLTLDSTATGRIWDMHTGKQLLELPGLASAAWSPDSQRIASARTNGQVQVQASEGQQQTTLSGSTDRIDAIVWSPDGRQLAASGQDSAVRIWGIDDDQQVASSLDAQAGPITALAWNPAQNPAAPRYVLAVGADNALRVWNIATHAQVTILKTASPIIAAAWRPDGSQILVAEASGRICIHDTIDKLLETVKEAGVQPLTKEEKERELSALLPIPAEKTEQPDRPIPPPPTITYTPVPPTASPSVMPEPPTPVPIGETTVAIGPTAQVVVTTSLPTLTPTSSATSTLTPTLTPTPSPTITLTITVTDTPTTTIENTTPTSTTLQTSPEVVTPPTGAATDTPTRETPAVTAVVVTPSTPATGATEAPAQAETPAAAQPQSEETPAPEATAVPLLTAAPTTVPPATGEPESLSPPPSDQNPEISPEPSIVPGE